MIALKLAIGVVALLALCGCIVEPYGAPAYYGSSGYYDGYGNSGYYEGGATIDVSPHAGGDGIERR
jgi:hypothetical protein